MNDNVAMFKWSGFYINPADVSAIATGADSSQSYPHYMIVHLHDSKEYRVNYVREEARNADAIRLAREVDRCQPEPLSAYKVEDLLDRMKGAIRRDIKALREEVMKGGGDA